MRLKSRSLLPLGFIALTLFPLSVKALPPTASAAGDVAADPCVRAVVAANTDFGFRLLQQLHEETPDKNLFFSPFSVSECLTMALNGAGGATKSDMVVTLGLNTLSQEERNQASSLLLLSLKSSDPKVQISAANALWVSSQMVIDPAFQGRCRQFYAARADTLDFQNPVAADTINDWVRASTRGRITGLVTAEDVKGASVVLTNAVYFHGLWQQPFDKSSTETKPFTLASGDTKMVPLMVHGGKFAYLETPEFQAVSLPYGQGRMSLYVFLPKQGSSLDEFVAALSADDWDEWRGKMRLAQVTVFLPRFKAEYETHLRDPLSALGMESAFGQGEDFKPEDFKLMGLHRNECLFNVIHKAVLDVDEQGTTAAAATATVGGMPGGFVPPNIILRADHPFFCAIRDNKTGTLLFAGLIQDPQ